MYQPPQPPQGFPPQPGFVPPQQPPQKNAFAPFLIGCGVVLLVLLIGGGIATYVVAKAFGGAIHRAADATGAASSIVQNAEKAAQDAEASAEPGHTPDPAAAGVAILKSVVNGGKSNVATLPRDELKAFLPASAAGLARGNAEGSSGSFAGISGTNASATYGTGPSVEIELTDAANMGGLTSMMDLLMGAAETESDEGFEKTVQLGDVRVHEKWENSGKHAELIGIVGGRFAVEVTGNGLDMSAAEQAFQAVDIAKLEGIASAAK